MTADHLAAVPEVEPDEARPYGSTAGRYYRTGSFPIPLPAGKKYPPPPGFTGYDGRYPTPSDVASWTREIPEGNVGLRLSDGVIGIDVDVYHGGDLGLADLESRFGKLPDTIASTSRGDGSGIRLYLVPRGRFWSTNPAEGVDVIQPAHRYVVVYPSLHPEGGVYQWVDTASGEILSIEDLPEIEDLPQLPWGWIEGLEQTGKGRFSDAAATPAEVQSFKAAHADAGRPGKLKGIETALAARTGAGKGRHDTLIEVACWAMREAAAGFYSAAEAEAVLARWWAGVMADNPRRRDGIEFAHAMAWAIAEAGADGARVAEIQTRAEQYVGPVAPLWIPEDLPGGPPPVPGLVEAPPPLPGVDPRLADDLERAHVIDWSTVWSTDVEEAWDLYPIVPRGRAVSIHAPGGAGKSEVVLAGVAAACMGRRVYGQREAPPIRALYVDYEMTRADLVVRLEALGYGPNDDLSRLVYLSIPSIGALDTAEGAERLARIARHYEVALVVIDTYARAVDGEENSADTVRAFYRHTGQALKAAGIGSIRIDHTGKDSTKGARGSSAKNDDVDVVWALERHARGTMLKRTKARVSWGTDLVVFERRVDESTGVLSYLLDEGSSRTFGPHARDDAALLDALGIPVSASRDAAGEALRAAGHSLRNNRIGEAQRWRRESAPLFTGKADPAAPGPVLVDPGGRPIAPAESGGIGPSESGDGPGDEGFPQSRGRERGRPGTVIRKSTSSRENTPGTDSGDDGDGTSCPSGDGSPSIEGDRSQGTGRPASPDDLSTSTDQTTGQRSWLT